jgi:hypothetical protein
MNKKPTVVANTAKKRGRPVGSKAKPKPSTSFKQVVVLVNDPIDWEKLAKKLQVALASQIRDNDTLEAELSRKRTFWERLVCLATGVV